MFLIIKSLLRILLEVVLLDISEYPKAVLFFVVEPYLNHVALAVAKNELKNP